MKAFATVLLLLASCDDMPRARTKSEIREVAFDAAEDVSDAKDAVLAQRITDLQRRVDELETEKLVLSAEVSSLNTEISNLKANDAWAAKSVNDLFYNDRIFAAQLGIPSDKSQTTAPPAAR